MSGAVTLPRTLAPAMALAGLTSACLVAGVLGAIGAEQGSSGAVGQVADIGYSPGSVGPWGFTRSAATGIANIAMHEGYQWAGGDLRNAPSCRT